MDNIIRMIDLCISTTGESVAILVELHDKGGFGASLVNSEHGLGETITFPNDWKMDLAASGDSIREAITALDALCAEGLA